MSSSEDDRNLSEDDDVSEDEIPEEEDDVSEDDVEEAPVKKRKGGASDAKPKPKKRRKPVNKFIEEEADVDEDEEEEEDDEDGDFYRSERALAEEAETSYRYEPQDRTQYDDTESAEEIVNRIKKRHHQSRKQYDEDDEGGDMMQSDVAQQSLLPSIQDPRMWVFKCKVRLPFFLYIWTLNRFERSHSLSLVDVGGV